MQDFAYLKSFLNDSIPWRGRALSVCPKHNVNPRGFQSRRCFLQRKGIGILTQQEGLGMLQALRGCLELEGSQHLNKVVLI